MTSSKESADPIKFVPKGWGYEKWIANGPEYCGKILFIAKDRRCSWHFHELKDEVFFVYRVPLKFIILMRIFLRVDMTLLGPGEKFHVPRGMRHQMVALVDTELFEFNTQHFDSDSYRLIKGD